jgi:Ca-activated chloride channel family protein
MLNDNDNNNESRLTAYALNEITDDAERREIESRVSQEPALQREVEEIRTMAGMLREQLAAEPLPERSIAPTMKIARRPTWGGRLAVAAAVSVVAGGLAYSIFTPSLNRARETASAVKNRAAEREVEQQRLIAGQNVTHASDAARAAPVDANSINATVATPAAPEAQTLTGAPSPAPAAAAETPRATGLSSFSQRQPFGVNASGAVSEDISSGTKDFYSKREVAELNLAYPGSANGQDYAFGGRVRESELGLGRGHNTEAYDRVVDNSFMQVMQNPLSTFSIDVDTASYANMRRFLMRGQRPPKDSVRIEELVNYFPYDYAPPAKSDEKPFASHVEVAACPWEPTHRLVRVGLKGREIAADKRPASNLVFLIDVSGSMQPQNKLPLVKKAMTMLIDQLNGEDRVAIVVYAGSSGLVLPSTACNDREKQSVLNSLEELSAGGSTNGGEGIGLAYSVAQSNFIQGGTNRVILCTDGDFNVGVTNQGDLTRLIEKKAKGGVFLSVLGFGMGNLKDSTMEKLADKGNGNYGYIDTIQEAKKVLVEQMSGTLITIAKDVKIQIEFNPAVVSSYRLIGYENRLLAKEDFNDDKKDAGEIGAGHAVTALYEVVPAGEKAPVAPVDALKYQKPAPAAATTGESGEMLTLKLRYKQPDGDTSALIEVPVKDSDAKFAKASPDFKFASAVAAFGMILRDSPHKGSANYGAVLEWAEDGVAKDPSGYRAEFLELVKKAKGIGQPGAAK